MIGTKLAHYEITRHLGTGGMGSVYRAIDTSLHRDVAIKVLSREVAEAPERLERFRREARALAALNHPNIVTIYSVEQDQGMHFLTMELVEGDSLDRVMAGQPMPLDRVRQLALAIVDALGAAHEKGIIHRDLKPSNVVLTRSGHAKLLDFGLAKVNEVYSVGQYEAAPTMATRIGEVLGTPAYMSPEQLSGLEVDRRTDIFSLGVMLYEMVAGVRPFNGRSQAELTTSILRDAPIPIQSVKASAPADLASIIARCLEKDAAARFPSMADVAKALKGDVKGVAAVEGPSIAVLPFRNLSTDPDSEFFGDGLAEEILNALSQIHGLRVAARASSFSFKGKAVEPAEIGAKLRVGAVLDGSVRRAGNRIRVTAQLVDASNGFQLWSERYDREMADIFDMQDEIARAIAEKLKLTLSGEVKLVKAATSNLQAYELYLRGRALLLKRGKHVLEASVCFKRAVDLDPSYASAWAGLADTFTVQAYFGMLRPADSLPFALTAARRAVQLDPLNGEAYSSLAMPLLMWDRNYDAAEAAFKKGVELSPNYTQGRIWHGLFSLQWVRGLHNEGIAEVRQAYENDPLSPYAASILGMVLSLAGQQKEAIALVRLGAERDPDALLGHWVHGLVAYWGGACEEAIQALQRARDVSGRSAMALAYMADAYASWGRRDEARALHDELLERSTRAYVPFVLLATSASAADDSDSACELLHQACDQREPLLVLIARLGPNLRRLRDDSRFADVLKRLSLPPGPTV